MAERLMRDACGATAIEWGLIAAIIAIIVVTMLSTIGSGPTSRRAAEVPKIYHRDIPGG
jgi:Flp pilus assembly pilin Flp